MEEIFKALGLIYDDPDRVSMAESKLRNLLQGEHTAEAYCVEFRRWATESEWIDPALRSQFCQGLSERLKDALAFHEYPDTLENAMSLAVWLDRCIRERYKAPSAQGIPSVSGFVSPAPQGDITCNSGVGEEPMQLGQVLFRSGNRNFRRLHKLCYYCGKSGHFIFACPFVKPHVDEKESQRGLLKEQKNIPDSW